MVLPDHETFTYPTVSVVVPIYNRATYVEPLLRSLFAQTYPGDRYEIIMVNDGSTDDTARVAERIAREWTGQFRLITQSNGGAGMARNTGLHASESDLVAFIDSDCVAEPDWLIEMVGTLTTTRADGVGGPIRNVGNDRPVSRYLQAIQFFRHRSKNGVVDYLITPNTLFRRAALLDVGGFGVRRGVGYEDTDLSFRLKGKGYRLVVSERGAVINDGLPDSYPALSHELHRYGYGLATQPRTIGKGRHPIIEIARHTGGVLLAPWLAWRAARDRSLRDALTWTPVIALEHSAFIVGVAHGMFDQWRGRHA